MLVVTRKKGQRLVIGGNTEVIVLSVNGHRVKLGISGPKEVPVLRSEARRRILPSPGSHQTRSLPAADKSAGEQ